MALVLENQFLGQTIEGANETESGNVELETPESNPEVQVATPEQVITMGPSQVGGGNTQVISPNNHTTINNISNIHHNYYMMCRHRSCNHGRTVLPTEQHFRFELGQHPGYSNVPRDVQRQQCPTCGQPMTIEPSSLGVRNLLESDSNVTAVSNTASRNNHPNTSEKVTIESKPANNAKVESNTKQKRNKFLKMFKSKGVKNKQTMYHKCEDKPKDLLNEPGSTEESSASVTVIDNRGRELKPGDVVLVERGETYYLGLFIYLGNLMMVGSEKGTQEVKTVPLDLRRPFFGCTPGSYSRCEFYSCKARIKRAMSSVGSLCPVKERGRGLDFVCWTLTGSNSDEALSKGFYLYW